MSLQRSKSAPQTVASTFLISNGRITRSVSSQHISRAAQFSSAISPRAEREDPFSLSGFFPSSRLEEEWSWLRAEEEEEAWLVDSEDAMGGTSAAVMFGKTEDDLTREAITREDKLGMLTLDALFSAPNRDADNRLFSPYTGDEPVDHESLYQALRTRRGAHGSGTSGATTSFGELFLTRPVGEEESKETGWSRWGKLLYDCVYIFT